MEYIKSMRKNIGNERLLLAGSSVIIYKNGKVFLQKRRDNELWGNHGGCVEIGETVEETARRELLEETGLVANKLELFNVYSGKDMLYTYPNGDEVKIDPAEVAELQWFDVNEIPEISPPLRRVFADFVEFVKKRDGV